jgi:translation initiation factor IF-1
MAKNTNKKKKVNSFQGSQVDEDRQDKIELEGIVEEALPGTWFKIKVNEGMTVLCTLSGRLRQNHIHVLLGDQVKIEVSPYDMSRGRISWRR